MKHLTKKEAIAFYESNVWKEWTDDQIARFQLFQPLLCVPFSRFHEAVEKVLGRPVYTTEFATLNLQKEYLGEKPAPTLEEIINLIPEDKRIVIGI